MIPPNKPLVRVDHPWQPFRTDAAAAEERDRIVLQALTSRRPLLIGTSSTSASVQIHRSVLQTVQQEQAAMQAAVHWKRRAGALPCACLQVPLRRVWRHCGCHTTAARRVHCGPMVLGSARCYLWVP